MKLKNLFVAAAIAALVSAPATADVLIGGSIADGNGDFNYEGGGTVSGVGSATPNENIPRDRFLIGSPNVNGTVDIDGWRMVRQQYNGGNNAFGLDGNFGLDDEAANTGSGQAFTNGNGNTIVDLIADQMAFSGAAGDIFSLSYLLGSDSGAANATVTLTLDAGLATEQVSAFAQVSRSGVLRDGSTSVSESYVSTGNYSTVDLTIQMNPSGSTRSLVDDVRLDVAAVPEPGSIALLGLVGVVCGLRRRR